MEALTIGDIAGTLGLIAGMITAGGVVFHFFNKAFRKTMQDELKPVKDSISDLQGQISDVDMANCKNYLVGFLSKVQCEGDFCQKITSEERERFWENYDHYIKLGGNSYVKNAVEKLKKEGKL